MLLTILVFIVILGLLVFVHELGHFVAAKRNGVLVDEFGFGFPPRILGIQRTTERIMKKVGEEKKELDLITDSYDSQTGREIISETKIVQSQELDLIVPVRKWRIIWGRRKQRDEEDENEKKEGGTIYSINAIPLGGFVKIFGEEGEGEGNKNSFISKKIWQKTLILVAGVAMNFLLAVILFSVGYMIGSPTQINEQDIAKFPDAAVTIASVSADSPAEKAGLQMGDKITALISKDGQRIEPLKSETQFQEFVSAHKGEEIILEIQQGGTKLQLSAVPRLNPPEGEGPLGVALAMTALIKYPWYTAIWMGFLYTVNFIWMIIFVLFQLIKNLIVSGRAGFELGGPVFIYTVTGDAIKLGLSYVINLAALLSVNLAVINILPIPALDGGRILFLIIEKIKKSPISQKTQNLANTIGFVLLILLMIFITYKDILRLH